MGNYLFDEFKDTMGFCRAMLLPVPGDFDARYEGRGRMDKVMIRDTLACRYAYILLSWIWTALFALSTFLTFTSPEYQVKDGIWGILLEAGGFWGVSFIVNFIPALFIGDSRNGGAGYSGNPAFAVLGCVLELIGFIFRLAGELIALALVEGGTLLGKLIRLCGKGLFAVVTFIPAAIIGTLAVLYRKFVA